VEKDGAMQSGKFTVMVQYPVVGKAYARSGYTLVEALRFAIDQRRSANQDAYADSLWLDGQQVATFGAHGCPEWVGVFKEITDQAESVGFVLGRCKQVEIDRGSVAAAEFSA
jgi:hypothetical protein